jgi:hypothetical protein
MADDIDYRTSRSVFGALISAAGISILIILRGDWL